MATARENLYPHHPTGCPQILNSSNRWKQFEQGVDAIITAGKGGAFVPIPQLPAYAPVSPLPIEWTGDDAIINGIRFTALHRVFRANADTVPALQYANPDALPVRRSLPKGEGFESLWLCTGDDGEPWLITRHWSRIPARLCLPRVEIIEDTGTDVLTLTVPEEVVA